MLQVKERRHGAASSSAPTGTGVFPGARPRVTIRRKNTGRPEGRLYPPMGDWKVAPPIRPSGIRSRGSTRFEYVVLRDATGEIGGADGIRTHDPLNAIQVLFQLSYSPTPKSSEAEL